MVAVVSEDLPHQNPCAQCARLIVSPEWFEHGPERVSYLWRCDACGYEFESVAFFASRRSDSDAIAA